MQPTPYPARIRFHFPHRSPARSARGLPVCIEVLIASYAKVCNALDVAYPTPIKAVFSSEIDSFAAANTEAIVSHFTCLLRLYRPSSLALSL